MFAPRIALRQQHRAFTSQSRSPILRRRNAAIASGAALTVALLAIHQLPSVHDDELASLRNNRVQSGAQEETPLSLAAHIRAYAVYSMCSIPFLVDRAPNILSVLRSVPGARQITDAFIRATFFSQVRVIITAQATWHDVIDLSSLEVTPQNKQSRFSRVYVQRIRARCWGTLSSTINPTRRQTHPDPSPTRSFGL